MGKKKEEALRKVMSELGITGSAPTAKSPPMALPTALSMLKNAAEVAEAQGDHAQRGRHPPGGARHQDASFGAGAKSQWRGCLPDGPGSAELFKTGLNTLPDDDKDLGYR